MLVQVELNLLHGGASLLAWKETATEVDRQVGRCYAGRCESLRGYRSGRQAPNERHSGSIPDRPQDLVWTHVQIVVPEHNVHHTYSVTDETSLAS